MHIAKQRWVVAGQARNLPLVKVLHYQGEAMSTQKNTCRVPRRELVTQVIVRPLSGYCMSRSELILLRK